MTTDPDAILSIRDLIVAESAITGLLSSYLGSPAVFTRVPVPDAATYPMITISRNIVQVNEDGIDNYRPVMAYEIAAHARNDLPPTSYRDVGTLGSLIRALFHRRRNITIPDWAIIDQRCTGPTDLSPVDQITTRTVTLTIRASMLVHRVRASLFMAGGSGHILNTTGGDIVLAGN